VVVDVGAPGANEISRCSAWSGTDTSNRHAFVDSA